MHALPRFLTTPVNSIALPGLLLLTGLALVGIQLDLSALLNPAATLSGPATVTIAPADFTYRLDGSVLRDGREVDAPLVQARLAEPLTIMQFQVSQADYARCVAEGTCAAAQNSGNGDIPVTGVNYDDATRYAAWLSQHTGQSWTLPTSEEWNFAAGEKVTDTATSVVDDDANPALRWLADYEAEAARKTAGGRFPQPLGSFGTNAHGLADIAGNVWEWTQTCHRRVRVDTAGTILSQTQACSIRLLEGQHRAPMSVFVRDAKSGGCSVGVPPANLGFRLVRRPGWTERLLAPFHS